MAPGTTLFFVAYAILADVSMLVMFAGLVISVASTAIPAVVYVRRRRFREARQRLRTAYSSTHFFQTTLDGLQWAFALGAIIWLGVRQLPFAMGFDEITGQLWSAAAAFVIVSLLCAKRWFNAMCRESGIAFRFRGPIDEPAPWQESLLQIAMLALVLALSATNPSVAFFQVTVTIVGVFVAHFVGVFLFTAAVTSDSSEAERYFEGEVA